EQRQLAEVSKLTLQSSGKFNLPIAVKILPAKQFYAAEDYHQHYYKKNPAHYERYSIGSGRTAFQQQHWGGKHE
ncbi:MAG: peptide-methionine (S)-S-oxide reductase, partial [Lysinibacillus sp.]